MYWLVYIVIADGFNLISYDGHIEMCAKMKIVLQNAIRTRMHVSSGYIIISEL